MGLLYGNGDPDRTIVIATPLRPGLRLQPVQRRRRAVHDDRLLEAARAVHRGARTRTAIFSHTAYNFPALVEVCEKLARQALAQAGGRRGEGRGRRGGVRDSRGRAEAQQAGAELGARPDRQQPLHRGGDGPDHGTGSAETLRRASRSSPPAGSCQLRHRHGPGPAGRVRRQEERLRHPPAGRQTGCVLTKEVEIPAGKKTTLRLAVGHSPAAATGT